ncbi:MAG: Ig domain-containing protein [Eubacterium sp.]
MSKKTMSKLTSLLLAAAMVLAFMPALTFSSHAATKKAKTSITRVAPKAAKTSVQVGKSLTFKVKVVPSSLAKKTAFTSSNAKVLTVNKKTGKASAKKAGTAKVTAKAGKLSASWTVKVTKAAKTERATEAATTLQKELDQFKGKTAADIAGMTTEQKLALLNQYKAIIPANITIDASVVTSLTADQQKMLAQDLEVLSTYDATVTAGTKTGNNATVNVKVTTYKYSTTNKTLVNNVANDFGLDNLKALYKDPTNKTLGAKLVAVVIKDLNAQIPAIKAAGKTTTTVTVPMTLENGVWQTTKTADLTKASNTGAFKLADAMTDGLCTVVADVAAKAAALIK